jgi:hypothetical protein
MLEWAYPAYGVDFAFLDLDELFEADLGVDANDLITNFERGHGASPIISRAAV